MKVGDAKLWVYDYESNYDCQAAENEFEFLLPDQFSFQRIACGALVGEKLNGTQTLFQIHHVCFGVRSPLG